MASPDTSIALLITCLLLSTASAGSFTSSALLAKRGFRTVLSAHTVADSSLTQHNHAAQEPVAAGGVGTAGVEPSNSSNTSESTSTIPPISRGRNSTINKNNTINGKAGISYAWIGPNSKSQRCLSACPEAIGATTWQLLAGMNGPDGRKPAKPLSFRNFSVQAVHGPCRQYAKDSKGLTKTYFGNEMSVTFRATNLTATICVFIDDLGKVQWFTKGLGYMCICQNTCDVPASASEDDNACELTFFWGGSNCPPGCSTCRCRTKRGGVYYVGWDNKGKCITAAGRPYLSVVDYAVTKCN